MKAGGTNEIKVQKKQVQETAKVPTLLPVEKIGMPRKMSLLQYVSRFPLLSVMPVSIISPINFRRSSLSTSSQGRIFDLQGGEGG